MTLQFKTQDFQTAAAAAVVDLFKVQPRSTDTFTIVNEAQQNIDEDFGIRNTLTLSDEQIVANMNAVQKRFSLSENKQISGGANLGNTNISRHDAPYTQTYGGWAASLVKRGC